MAKAKLKTVDRITSVSRDSVKEMITKTAKTGNFVSVQPKSSVGEAVKKKK